MYIRAAVFAILVITLTIYLQLHRRVNYNDEGCQLLPNIGPGSEDLVLVHNELVLASTADLDRITLKNHWNRTSEPGSLFAIYLSGDIPRAERVPMEGFPHPERFHPHGIYFSNSTGRVYAVSHDCGNETFEGIEVFRLVFNENHSIKLVYEATLTSPSFPLGSMNDVIEGVSLGEVYVTQWLHYPIHRNCVHQANVFDTTRAKFTGLFRRVTKVHRCVWDPAGPSLNELDCRVVAEGFKCANGITTDPDRKHVYVVDAADGVIHFFERHPDTGSLTRTYQVPMLAIGDNIEYDMASGNLTFSIEPLRYQVFMRLEGHVGMPVSGGMATLDPLQVRDGSATGVHPVVLHDGTKLSTVSSGIYAKDKVILGSFASDGVLICPTPAS